MTKYSELALKSIDYLLMFQGHVSVNQLAIQLGVSAVEAEQSLMQYHQLYSGNLVFNDTLNRYLQTEAFVPQFDYACSEVLAELASDLTVKVFASAKGTAPIGQLASLNMPELSVVAPLVQAITNRSAIRVEYTSLSSGRQIREWVPHTIVNNGLRWHVRAFDRKSAQFRDFVLTRITDVIRLSEAPHAHELQAFDEQWHQMIDLVLAPHPLNIKHPTAIELDYNMSGGELVVPTRAALAPYLLRGWNVDCTRDASLKNSACQLWLKNHAILVALDNPAIVPR